MVSVDKLKAVIARFPKARVMVIGDLILDEYIWGSVERISPEAPVPVVWANKRTYVPGGASNVANNMRALDARVSLVGVAGDDAYKNILFRELKKRKIPVEGVFIDPVRHTTLKTRIVAGHQQVVRVDWEHTYSLTQKLNDRIIDFVRRKIKQIDALIIEDYGKGVINRELLGELNTLAHTHKKIVTVDPKEDHFRLYSQTTAITPNRKELENAVRNLKISDTDNSFTLNSDKLFTDKDIDRAGKEIMRYLNLETLLVTLGEQGVKLFEKGGRISHIPTVAQEVFDVSGAGDTVISCFSLCLACGAGKLEAAYLANFAAGIVVGKVGTAVTNRKELLEKIG